MKVLLLRSALRALISGLRDLFAPRTHATSEKSDEEDLHYPGPLHATSEKSDEEDLHGNGSHYATSETSDEPLALS